MSLPIFLVDWNNQNMQSVASDMPRKKYIRRSNICVICGLSFIQTVIMSEIQCKILLKQKLRLTHFYTWKSGYNTARFRTVHAPGRSN
jgi:hypothetical protein